MGSAERKIPGGKLVSVQMEYNDTIQQIRIYGDFFIHPEEALYAIESEIVGLDPRNKHAVVNKITSVVQRFRAEMIGVSPEEMANVISMAVK